jgi:hypothetical protein
MIRRADLGEQGRQRRENDRGVESGRRLDMPTAEVFTPKTFAEQWFTTAEQSGFKTKLNRNGVRQIDFANKSLTEEHVCMLFKDISRNGYVYSRAEAKMLLASRPCAIAPFFTLAVKAGLASGSEESRKKIFRFSMGRMSAPHPT